MTMITVTRAIVTSISTCSFDGASVSSPPARLEGELGLGLEGGELGLGGGELGLDGGELELCVGGLGVSEGGMTTTGSISSGSVVPACTRWFAGYPCSRRI